MTIETYPEMDAKIVSILRTNGERVMTLYAAQRIEELERVADIRDECLRIAMETLGWYIGGSSDGIPAQGTLTEIKTLLAELEPGDASNDRT